MPKQAAYDNIDFTPPQDVAKAAERGLKLREEHGRGGTHVGVARARGLSARKAVAPGDIKKISAYFARHDVDNRGKNWGDRNEPSAGYIAWLLWGGDPGRRWSDAIKKRMARVDER